MAYLDDLDTSDPYASPDLIAQAEALQRRKAILVEQARLAAQQAGVYAPHKPENAEVGGFQLSSQTAGLPGQRISGRMVPQSWGSIASAAAPLLAQHRLQGDQAALGTEEAQYNARARADRDRRLAAMPTATPGTPTTYGAGDEGPTMTPGTPATEPTLRERLEWAAGLKDSPLLSGVGDLLTTDIITKEPERVEARAERKAEKEAARAEARRKQQEDLDFKRWQTGENNELRALIAGLVHGGKGGGGGSRGGSSPINLTDDDGNPVEGWKRSGVKASDIVKDVASDGTVTLTDKLTGQRLTVGGGGRPSATHDKTLADEAMKVKNAREGLVLLRQMEPLLGVATSSNLGALRDAAGGIVGWSGKAGDAAGELSNMGANLVSLIDRSGLGPQFSDSDLKFLINKSGGLGDPTIPESRKRAVYTRVLGQFQRAAGVPSREAGGPVDSKPLPGSDMLRQPTPRKKYNPATGRVE